MPVTSALFKVIHTSRRTGITAVSVENRFARAHGQAKCLNTTGVVLAVLLMLPANSMAQSPAIDFEKEIAPILSAKCSRCHGPKESNADVRLDRLSTDLTQQPRGAETWHDVLNAVNRGEMPPKDELPLTSHERRKLTNWISGQLNQLRKLRSATGGRVVMKRLNRAQYQNTMTDLLGVSLNYIANLPPDPFSADGFQNNGSALQMSALQLEYYLKAARAGLQRAIVKGPAPQVFEHVATDTEKDKGKGNWNQRLGRSGTFVARIKEFPDEGTFVLKITAHAEIPAAAMDPIMQVKLGFRADVSAPSKVVGTADVSSTDPQVYEFSARFEEFPIQSRTQSKYPGMLVWIDNIYDDGRTALGGKGKADTNSKKRKNAAREEDPNFPKIVIDKVEFKAPVYQSWPPAHHKGILPEQPRSESEERSTAQQALQAFLPRAYRRPITASDLDTTLKYFDTVRPSMASFEDAMREVVAMSLVSPDFIYIAEPNSAAGLNEFQLASRLSYFLWNTMPDAELFAVAQNNRLSDRQTLQQQVARMLDDHRSQKFIDQFADQWLDLSGVDRVAVNPEFYPEFEPGLKPLFRRETTAFFADILQSDTSALQLLDADYTMLNERLARHYGRSGPRGSEFERVPMTPENPRGGLLGHASILLANSTGEDSHPIKRAVWIRERLLNDPPAPPPPDVPDLNQDLPELVALPLKEQLQLHLENDACADCHRGIDPWGVALDRFDAVGLKREFIHRRNPKKSGGRLLKHPVDTEVVLPDGSQINGLTELKLYLQSHRKREFARTLVVKLLTYGLGRSLEFTDEELVDRLTDQFESSGFRLKSLITAIVCCESFRR